jgi:urea transporter
LLLEAGITPLSIPFVVSAWLVIGVQTTLARKR